MEKKPVLSIGIIFKNEIRCLERCLKSFDKLREAVPCELVMADTGSDDGSREVARRYADILIDFPWINDFAAARNAVLDRCSGTWFLTVDADEWLDEDITELTNLLKKPKLRGNRVACALVIRNYMSQDLKGDYSDFMASRMFLMSTGIRYEGAIHEHWTKSTNDMLGLGRTVLHHDGYVGLGGDKGAGKRKRNMEHLRKMLEENPRDLLPLLQCTESSSGYEQLDYIRRGLDSVRDKLYLWKEIGPPMFRYAASFARAAGMPEMWDWAAEARELFPNSIFVRVDIAYYEFGRYIEEKKYAEAIPFGEEYLAGLADYRAWKYDVSEVMYSSLSMIAPSREDGVRVLLASAYFYEKQPERAWKMFQELDVRRLNEESTKNYLGMLLNLYAQNEIDTSGAIAELWKTVSVAGEEKRKSLFLSLAAELFPQGYRDREEELGFRHAYQALLPLGEQCGPGIAAQLLETEDVSRMQSLLEDVEDWDQISIHALAWALEKGMPFPLPGKTLKREEADRLARRLKQDGRVLCLLAARLDAGRCAQDMEYLVWAESVALSAVLTFPWQAETADTELGFGLARKFAEVEGAFQTVYYSLEVLRERQLFILPPIHRFGWYCSQAFDALKTGDTVDYVRLLRGGLAEWGSMKGMVDFLTEHTPELGRVKPSAELLALAEKVRAMLAAYPADDPAVKTLKASPVYQKVAYLIEGEEE